MFYLYNATCISPQHTFGSISLDTLYESAGNKLSAIEPRYEGMPANALRRMSKAVKLGLAAAAPLINAAHLPDGIVIGSGNGGMEESGRFLNQIVDYNEDLLTPGNFVQSTPNTVTSQLCMLLKRREYNITHVQRGLSFENAITDVDMLLREHPDHTYLLGGVDEIAAYNHEIDKLGGWFRQKAVSNHDLYINPAPGSIAGEGVAMFLAGSAPLQQALGQVAAYSYFNTPDINLFESRLQQFLAQYMAEDGAIHLLLSGDGGDSRQHSFYQVVENQFNDETTVGRFKHMSGEYPTVSSFALWLGCMVLSRQVKLPAHAIKRQGTNAYPETILIHNTHKGLQHSLILLKRASH